MEMSARRYIWATAIQLFQDRPFLGSGCDTFALAFPRHRTPAYWQIEWNAVPAKAHNEVLHLLATQGLAGALACGILVLGIFRVGLRALRGTVAGNRKLIVVLLASVSAFLVQNLFGFTVAGCGTLFVTCAALVSRLGDPQGSAPANTLSFTSQLPGHKPPRPIKWRLLCPAVQAIILFAAFALANHLVLRPVQASCAACEGERLLSVDPAKARACQEQAVLLDPGRDLYWTKLAVAAQAETMTCPSGPKPQSWIDCARQALERAVVLVPASADNHANLGRLFGLLARQKNAAADKAFDELDAALRLDPCNVYLYADAGQIALSLGDIGRTRAYAQRGQVLFPDFGPLLAQLAYVAFKENQRGQAIALLEQAVDAEWHSNEQGRLAARESLQQLTNRRGAGGE
jgi:Tfp pilus assembly protein PilF